MTIRTCACSLIQCSLGAKSRMVLLFILLVRVHLGSSTFAQSCQTEEDRAVSLSDGEKVWLRTTAESVQLNGSSTECNLERDTLFKVTGKNDSLVISAIKASTSRVCEMDGVLLQVPKRSVFVSCRKNKDRAKEELEAIISAPNHGTIIRRAGKEDANPTIEPPPSTTDLPTEDPVTVDEFWTGEDEEQPPSSMAPEEVTTTTTSGARENPAPAGPPAIPFTPKLETTIVVPTKVSTIQMTPSETILITALNILPPISPTIVPSSRPIVPSRVATTLETTLLTTSPTLRPTPTVPIVVRTSLPPSSPEATESHEATSTEETMSEGGKEATKPPLQESTPKLQESQDMPSIIMANLPYVIGGAAGILLLLVFITVFVVVSRRRKRKASVPVNIAAGRADYVRHQDAMDSQDMANVNILMYAADEAQHHVELDDIIDRHKDESSVPVIPKCLQDDNFD